MENKKPACKECISYARCRSTLINYIESTIKYSKVESFGIYTKVDNKVIYTGDILKIYGVTFLGVLELNHCEKIEEYRIYKRNLFRNDLSKFYVNFHFSIYDLFELKR